MTALGKILVFFNLIFSLIVGALVVMDYAARTRWADELEKSHNLLKVAYAQTRTAQAERDQVEQKLTKELESSQTLVKNLTQDLDKARATIAERENEKKELTKEREAFSSAQRQAQAEASLRQQDVDKLRTTVKKLSDENTDLVEKRNQAVALKVQAEIERNAFKERSEQLENRLQELARDYARLRSNLGRTTRVASRTGKNPPSERVEGQIARVDNSGLMSLTIGADAGLQRGHTLEVFRLNRRRPDQSLYLGTVRIIEVTPTKSVAQGVGRLRGEIRPGDTAASQILGK